MKIKGDEQGGEAVDETHREIQVSPGEMLQIQQLIEYAMPSVYGWHVLYNP